MAGGRTAGALHAGQRQQLELHRGSQLMPVVVVSKPGGTVILHAKRGHDAAPPRAHRRVCAAMPSLPTLTHPTPPPAPHPPPLPPPQYFTVKMSEGVQATSYSKGDKFFIDPQAGREGCAWRCSGVAAELAPLGACRAAGEAAKMSSSAGLPGAAPALGRRCVGSASGVAFLPVAGAHMPAADPSLIRPPPFLPPPLPLRPCRSCCPSSASCQGPRAHPVLAAVVAAAAAAVAAAGVAAGAALAVAAPAVVAVLADGAALADGAVGAAALEGAAAGVAAAGTEPCSHPVGSSLLCADPLLPVAAFFLRLQLRLLYSCLLSSPASLLSRRLLRCRTDVPR